MYWELAGYTLSPLNCCKNNPTMKYPILVFVLFLSASLHSQSDMVDYTNMELIAYKNKNNRFVRIKKNRKILVRLNNSRLQSKRFGYNCIGQYRIIDSTSFEIDGDTIQISEVDIIKAYRIQRNIVGLSVIGTTGVLVGGAALGGDRDGVLAVSLVSIPANVIAGICVLFRKNYIVGHKWSIQMRTIPE